MSSTLQFPNARLYILNLLRDEHLTGAEAIARGACEYGVINWECLEDAELIGEVQTCDCGKAAHCVLRKYFDAKSESYDSTALENSWKSLTTRLKKYVERHGPTGRDKEPDCEQVCSNLAPVMFDLILQEVRRYS